MGLFTRNKNTSENENAFFCTKCGSRVNATDVFCKNCGQKVMLPASDSSANTMVSNRPSIPDQPQMSTVVTPDTFMSVDFLPARTADSILKAEYISYPLGSLASLASAASGLGGVFASLSQFGAKSGNLFRVTFEGGLAKAKGQGIGAYRGFTQGANGRITSHAVLRPAEAESVTKLASSASSVFLAIAIFAINQTLGQVLNAQKDIINFLEVDKQAKLKSELIFLTDVMKDYQYNKDNPNYITNREQQVAEIKRDAEQNIIFYKERINQKFVSQPLFHINTEKVANDVQTQFKLYQLSLYLYAYASFLDIMLLENFQEDYLNGVESKITDYKNEFDEFYQATCDKMDRFVRTSVQSTLMKGVSIASNKVGDVADKTNRLGKLAKSLHTGGNKLHDFNEDINKKTISIFFENNDSGIDIFQTNIHQINVLSNRPVEMVFAGESLYVKELQGRV